MKTWFVIDTKNAITAFHTEQEAQDAPGMRYAFADRSSLLVILSENPRLGGEILSGLAGIDCTPEEGEADFTPKAAAKLIWEGIQHMATVLKSPPKKPVKVARVRAHKPVAAAKAPKSSKKATKAKREPKAEKKAKAATSGKSPKKTRKQKETAGPREGTKAAKLIELLKRPDGITLAAIVKKFDWQPHTTRGLLSAGGSLRKMGIVVESFKPEGGERTYRIAS